MPPDYALRIGELPEHERPLARLLHLGPSAVTTAELVAILPRTGTAREDAMQIAARLLREHDGLRGLAATEVRTIAHASGIGPARATTVAAAFELGRRATREEPPLHPLVRGPADIARLLESELGVLPHEELHLLVMDTRHRVLSASMLYRGSVNAAPGRVAEVFREAVRMNATAIAVAHNHPSGDPAPSRDDVDFTGAVVAAGELLNISVLDHLVFGRDRYVSMRERRLGFR